MKTLKDFILPTFATLLFTFGALSCEKKKTNVPPNTNESTSAMKKESETATHAEKSEHPKNSDHPAKGMDSGHEKAKKSDHPSSEHPK